MIWPAEHEELTNTLLKQNFASCENTAEVLKRYQQSARDFVLLDKSLAVLSDYSTNKSYIYSGGFGQFFGINESEMIIDSAFEEDIFKIIHPDDLKLRHLLELRYFNFQKSLPTNERPIYSTFCKMRALNADGNYTYISHRTLYPVSHNDRSIWLALCLYAPIPFQQPINGIEGLIIDTATGTIVAPEILEGAEKSILSEREIQVLSLIAKGLLSKQVAISLNISVNTVNRHRQNILQKLRVANTAEAISVALNTGVVKTFEDTL